MKILKTPQKNEIYSTLQPKQKPNIIIYNNIKQPKEELFFKKKCNTEQLPKGSQDKSKSEKNLKSNLTYEQREP